jgi:excisionase family DNA binding protein
MTLMTVNDVADQLQVHPRTVKRWIAEGQLTAFKLGDRAGWRISEEDVQKFLAERRQGAVTGKAAARISLAAA